jgi:hypothetical protein
VSVLSYLRDRAADLVLSASETEKVNTSIAALESRLNYWFPTELAAHFKFGSSTRGTILPRWADEHSDIDYMVVFKESGFTPQTYLNRLKGFAEFYYQSSEIWQSSPTIVLELNHIKFELVPALSHGLGSYKIPDGAGGWRETNPNDINTRLTLKNNANGYCIKPAIRLAKYWNACNGYVFDSYGFERWIVVDRYFSACTNLRDYLFAVFDGVHPNTGAQWRDEKIRRAKSIIAQVRHYEGLALTHNAEVELKKLIPE